MESTKKTPVDEVVELVKGLEGLHISDPKYQTLYALGADPHETGIYIVISFWFFKQFIQPESRGYRLNSFKKKIPIWSACNQWVHADHFQKEPSMETSGYIWNEISGFFHN